MKNKELIKSELFEHLPFTIFGVALGILLLAGVQALVFRGTTAEHESLETFYHIFHAFHILLSALTSTAVAFRVGGVWPRALVIGAGTTIVFCMMSDSLLPFLGGFLLQAPMHLHICALEEPLLVFSFLGIGVVAGVVSEQKIGKVSYLSHGAHVLISSFASLFYLAGFGLSDWVKMLGPVFLITLVAVVIPCCLSDIIFPVSFTHAEHDHNHPR